MKNIFLLFILITGLHLSLYSENNEPETCLTIFVHGIMSVKYHMSFPNIMLFIKDQVANSAYQKTVEIIRNDPYFHQSHPIQQAGLHLVDLSLEKPGAAPTLFSRLWEQVDATNNNDLKNNIYYTFGWTGLLSPTVRRFEAQVLYNLLKKEVKKFQEKGIHPKIRIVGYSHGGNVALEMATVKKKNKVMIDELILIGVPVVKTADFLRSHKMFKRIFHFYSKGDRVQNLDLLSWQRWFAIPKGRSKKFEKLPENLTQIEIRVKRLTKHQLERAQKNPDGTVLTYNKKAMRVADPGHTELWSFGWGTSSYSKHNPFYPLPTGVFIPYLINTIKTEPNFQDHIIADIYTHEHTMFLRHKQNSLYKKINFLSKPNIDGMLTLAKKYEPANYSIKEYDARVAQAKKEGKRLAKLEENKNKKISV